MTVSSLFKHSVLWCCCALALGAAAAPAWAALNVIYPRIEERPRDDYGYKVLDLALSKAGVAYTLSMSRLKMNQERARTLLEEGVISVFDAGQGPGWADITILRAAGIGVKTSEFELLFRMLNAKRIDFYPLGADEIFGLAARYRGQAPDIMVEPRLALQYPFARLFFVRKGDGALRDAIYAGLQKAFADGSFQNLLEADPGFHASVARANLSARTVISIPNPNLSESFRQIPREYFYVP
jgi:hypothetical protein